MCINHPSDRRQDASDLSSLAYVYLFTLSTTSAHGACLKDIREQERESKTALPYTVPDKCVFSIFISPTYEHIHISLQLTHMFSSVISLVCIVVLKKVNWQCAGLAGGVSGRYISILSTHSSETVPSFDFVVCRRS